MPLLTAIDTIGVQKIIFSSNRLKDIIAGSYLVDYATNRETIEDCYSKGDIIYAGGGNAIIKFEDEPVAIDFAAKYSRKIHNEVPGLEILIVHHEYEECSLAEAIIDLQTKVAKSKFERKPSVPLLGISVTASCQETGMPATKVINGLPVSKDIANRRAKVDEALKRWQDEFLNEFQDQENDLEYEFPKELDDLGRTHGDTSLIGIVHIDGNGIGQKIIKWLNENKKLDDNQLITEYKKWSKGIDDLGKRVLRKIIETIICSIDKTEEKIKGNPEWLNFSIEKKDGKFKLPIRPIILGGDDITFVCDGRIALDLARKGLEEFPKGAKTVLGTIYGSAGVALVGVHSPFYRGYELAEKLCSSAKSMLRKEAKVNKKDEEANAIDWQLGNPRPTMSVEAFRNKEYSAKDLKFTCRPYVLGSENEEESFIWLSDVLLGEGQTGLRGTQWHESHNKAKQLLENGKMGYAHMEKIMNTWKSKNKELDLPKGITRQYMGYYDQTKTPLIDASEILDLHLVLKSCDTKTKDEK